MSLNERQKYEKRFFNRSGNMAAISILRPLTIAVIVLLACIGLFWLDHETHSFRDLLKPGNLAALVIYFTPTFLISYGLYRLFLKKNSPRRSMMLGLLLGIIAGFFLVIVVLLALRPS